MQQAVSVWVLGRRGPWYWVCGALECMEGWQWNFSVNEAYSETCGCLHCFHFVLWSQCGFCNYVALPLHARDWQHMTWCSPFFSASGFV